MTLPKLGVFASLLAILALASPADALTVALVGQALPTLAGRNLLDAETSLPRDFKGKPGVVVAGFSLGARADATQWATKVAQQFVSKGRLDAYVLVVIEAPAFVEGLVAAALRAGQSEDLYRWGLTVMDPDKVLRAQLGVGDDALAQVLLVGADGKVRWATGDGFTAGRWASFEQAVAAVAPAPKAK